MNSFWNGINSIPERNEFIPIWNEIIPDGYRNEYIPIQVFSYSIK